MRTTRYTPQVREQYEEFPYPPRDPSDEQKRLIRTWLDDLPMINHYCFAGRQAFRDRFRVLIAGGGTGDATIFLAEQLRHSNAEIVHIDLSQSSIEIARQRARARALNNISWLHASLLALPGLGLGKFDYINCSGVLHHLEDPDAGLRALLAVLKDSGALGIMVYATYGRTGVYQMQSLMRLINQGETDAQRKLANTREVLDSLPHTNWFKRGEGDLYHDHKDLGDAGIYDLLLHSQDRAYTVGELYDWFHDRHGLHLELTDVGRGRSVYLPEMVTGPKQPHFLRYVQALSPRQQHEIAELLGGSLITHSFFATRSPDTRAPYGDPDYVPFFFHEPLTGPELSTLVQRNKSLPFVINHAHTGIAVQVDPGKFGEYILQHADGKRSFGEIFSRVRTEPKLRASSPTDEELFRDFRPFFDFLTAIDRLLLRHRSNENPHLGSGPNELGAIYSDRRV